MGFMKQIRRMFGDDEAEKKASGPMQITRMDDPNKAAEALSNQQQREALAAANPKEGGFSSIVRGKDEIEQSGVLGEFSKLDTSELEGKSEYRRTLDDDAALVRKGFSGYSAEEIAQMKDAAFVGTFADEQDGKTGNETWRDENQRGEVGAREKDHYGSDLHKEYGATVEYLSGGLISAEEAMAMNPTGGIAGPGAKGIAFSGDHALRRHAIRHDAVGFLQTRFDVGPGYGTKTTALGLDSDNPLAGQWLGIAREMGTASDKLDFSEVGTSKRFGSGPSEEIAKKPKK